MLLVEGCNILCFKGGGDKVVKSLGVKINAIIYEIGFFMLYRTAYNKQGDNL